MYLIEQDEINIVIRGREYFNSPKAPLKITGSSILHL
jgi:hypothetical protein